MPFRCIKAFFIVKNIKEVFMKIKIISLFLLVCVITIPLYACEKSTQLRTAYFQEITVYGSENYGVRITYDQDKRLKDKGTDVQIKFNNIGTIKIGKEAV